MNESLLSWIERNVDRYPVTADLFVAAKKAFPHLNRHELAVHLRESARRAFAHADALCAYSEGEA
jgi:hypothetical protein